MVGRRAGIGGLAGLAGLVLAGCVSDSPRAALADDSAIVSTLGFLREAEVDRAQVLARLGAPGDRFEGGRIVAYTVYFDPVQRRLTLRPGAGACFGLMIDYTPQGRVARHALIRHGAADCPKDD